MFWFGGDPAGMALSQGKSSSGLIFLSRDRSLVSMRSIIAVTSAGLFVIRLVSRYRIEERLGGVLSLCCLFRDSEFYRMDLRVSLDFLMNMASRADPYLWQRVLLTSLIVRLAAIWCSL